MSAKYLIRSRGRALVVRDGKAATDPVYDVTPRAWVPFENLPAGVSPSGDGDLEIREIVSADDLAGIEKPEPRKREPRPEAVKPEQQAPRGGGRRANRGNKATLAGRLTEDTGDTET